MTVVRELEVDIELPDGAKLLTGKLKTMLGQLTGRDHKSSTAIWSGDDTSDRAKVEWVIEAEPGTEVTAYGRSSPRRHHSANSYALKNEVRRTFVSASHLNTSLISPLVTFSSQFTYRDCPNGRFS